MLTGFAPVDILAWGWPLVQVFSSVCSGSPPVLSTTIGLFANRLFDRHKFRYHKKGASNHQAVEHAVAFLAGYLRSAEHDTNRRH